MLPVPVAEAVLDFYPIEETVGEHGPMVRGLLLAAVKESVLANVNAIRLAGLTAIDVDLIPFALSRVLLSRPDVSGTVALVDIGGSTTSVLIATDGVPQFVRIIATGGDDVTQSLREGLGSQGEDPEVMKRRLGLATGSVAPSDKMAVEIIYKVASEQLSILRNTINYFVNTRPIEAVSSIILTGGGAQMEGLPTALADQTRLSVVVGDPFVSVTLGSGVDEADIRRRSSALTVALGLALWRAS
jgi:type IV pilus assembly protein PilM